jgi:molybdopterin/thiamine biosynthesis adenylyltransferase
VNAQGGAVPGEEDDVFARHHLIPGWQQGLLKDALVVVAGIGALGNEVARLLAMAGLGRLILCDPDQVSRSNLSRTVLFRESDIGRSKARAAADTLGALAPWTEVDARDAPLVGAVGLAELREATLVAGCLDSRAARLQLSSRCQKAAVPLVDGGTSAWGGEVGFYPPDAPCYGCWMTVRERAEKDDPWSCQGSTPAGRAGASAPISSVIGAWQSTLAVRHCLGLAIPPGVVRIMPGYGKALSVKPLGIDPSCPMHGAIDEALITLAPIDHRATVAELVALLDRGEEIFSWAPFSSSADRTSIGIRLRDAPGHSRLADLGVAPREVLAVHSAATEQGFRYIELSITVASGRERRIERSGRPTYSG